MNKFVKKYCTLILCLSAAVMIAGCAGAPLLVGLGSGAVIGHEYAKEKRNCPYCDKKISRKATVCPHCGNEVQPILTGEEKQQFSSGGSIDENNEIVAEGGANEYINPIE